VRQSSKLSLVLALMALQCPLQSIVEVPNRPHRPQSLDRSQEERSVRLWSLRVEIGTDLGRGVKVEEHFLASGDDQCAVYRALPLSQP
jgi:hypothetical protein